MMAKYRTGDKVRYKEYKCTIGALLPNYENPRYYLLVKNQIDHPGFTKIPESELKNGWDDTFTEENVRSDGENGMSKIKVSVYLDDGRVFEYDVDDPMKGREHSSAIIKTGYRHSENNNLEWYPPHRILKVKVENGAESTNYKDNTRAT